MCDCLDEYNINEIPVGPIGPQGPAGPQGPQGPAGPSGVGTSSTNLTVGTGVVSLTVGDELGYGTAQRLRIASDDASKIMEGNVISYAGTVLEMNIDYTVGSGSHNDWNISIAGSRGATGATGATGPAGSNGAAGVASYSTMSAGVNIGGLEYRLTVDESAWMSVGQIVYIEGAGYYEVTHVNSGTEVEVENLNYTGNNPTGLTAGIPLKISPGGIIGANGTNGTDGFNYETTDGNNIPAEATSSYQFLMRNADDTGYTFVSLADLKVLLNSIP